jgi:hypothetical protein
VKVAVKKKHLVLLDDNELETLLNLMNRANVVGFGASGGRWIGFCVDDRAWEAKLNLVSEMNTCYGRLEYLTNGTFTSEEHKLQWLRNGGGSSIL